MFVEGMMSELGQARRRDLMMEAARFQIQCEARELRAKERSERHVPSRYLGWLRFPAFLMHAFRGAPVS